jgi:hypothetical protein
MNHRCAFVTVPCYLVAVAIAFLALASAPTKTQALKHNYYTRRDERRLIGPLGFPFGFLVKGQFNLTVFDFQLTPIKKAHIHNNNNDNNNNDRSLAWGKSAAAAKVTTSNAAGDCDSRTELCLSDVLDQIEGVGFLLKQFKDEAVFNQYMSSIQESGNCIFQKYLDYEDDDHDNSDDDFTYDVDDMVYGYGSDDRFDDRVDDGDDDYGHRSRRQQQQMKRQRRQLGEEGPQGYGEVILAKEDGIYLDMLPRTHWQPNSVSAAYDFQTDEAGFYFLIYQVCYKTDGSQNLQDTEIYDIHTRFELDFHFSNVDMFGHKSYLSYGEMVSTLTFSEAELS